MRRRQRVVQGAGSLSAGALNVAFTMQVAALAAASLLLVGCIDEPAAALDGPEASLWVRPDTPGNNLLFRFEPDDLVETYGSAAGSFLVHYTRDGVNGVPAADADSSGVPDFVEQVADVYEQVLDHYTTTLGFRPPISDENVADNGGDGRFDVYLVDFNFTGDGNFAVDSCSADKCAGYMVQENDFAGYGYPSTSYANRVLCSHEFFHAIQAAYDQDQGSVFGEGSAVWATESFDPSLDDFELFLDGYLSNPDRSLDVPLPGPVDPFSYGSALFFQFLEERYGDGMVRALWERVENGAFGVADPSWFSELDPMLQAEAGVSFAEAFVEHARYNLFTKIYGDPSRGYQEGVHYPPVKMDQVAAPFFDDSPRYFYASTQYYEVDPAGRTQMTAAALSPDGDPADTEGLVMLLAARGASDYDTVVEVADIGAAAEVIDTSAANALVVAVVNTLQEGDSKRPAVCIGSPEEVSACIDAVGVGVGGAGGGGAGGAPSSSGGDETDEGGCGCELPGGTNEAPPPGWWLAAAALAWAGRRRRR